jgi:hypothetical protein
MACPEVKGKSPRKREKPQKMDYSGTRKEFFMNEDLLPLQKGWE